MEVVLEALGRCWAAFADVQMLDARNCASEEEYHERMELPREPETLCGYNGLSCYYPEISFATR